MRARFTRIRLRVGMWLLSAVLFTAAGCGGPTIIVQQYSGHVRPRSEIAIIRILGVSAVQLMALDGTPVRMGMSRDARLHIEVLPGEHELDVANVLDPLKRTERVRFQARAGAVYRVTVERAPGIAGSFGPEAEWVARVYEVNDETDAIVRDVTQEAVPRSPPPSHRVLEAPRPKPSAASATPSSATPPSATPPSATPPPATPPPATPPPATPPSATPPSATPPPATPPRPLVDAGAATDGSPADEQLSTGPGVSDVGAAHTESPNGRRD